MRTRLASLFAGSAIVLVGIAGCQCCNRRPAPAPIPPPPACQVGPPPTGAYLPGPPSGAPVGSPGPALPPGPAPVGNEIRNYEPPSRVYQGGYYWTPSAAPAPERTGVRLETPVPYDPEASGKVAPRAADAKEPAKTTEERDPTDTLPVDIAQFGYVGDKVASGLKPQIGGLDWLRDAGYRTVLHLRKPGEDDAADRKLVTKRGMTFASLEVSPQTLTSAVFDEFSKVVAGAKTGKLFVYDGDGVLAGGLWYLYFRAVEKDSDETARLKAARLGLKENAEGEAKAMWVAVQKVLSERGG
jgi:hypothetical protein